MPHYISFFQGFLANPTYEEVCSGRTGHTEAVQVTFDPSNLPYSDLLTVFFDIIDPTTVNGQGNDFGSQYRTGVYYHSSAQEAAATEKVKQLTLQYAPRPIATEVKEATAW
ncbi:peptide-methionine (S)-S-oxide reductase [archaeon]|nr:MAG: peptide-methionine (S)-S-oxide reductase [archaeon]